MAHTTKHRPQLLTRVRRIKGQAEALERSLVDGNECIAILQQIAAVRGAVNGLMNEVLEGHIREHLADPDLDPKARVDDLEAVLKAVRSYLK